MVSSRFVLLRGEQFGQPDEIVCGEGEDELAAYALEFCKENPALCRVADDTHKQGSEKFDEGTIDGWKAFMEKYELERKRELLDSILQR